MTVDLAFPVPLPRACRVLHRSNRSRPVALEAPLVNSQPSNGGRSSTFAVLFLGVAGPLLAVLHLTDALPFGLRGSLWDPGLVVMAAAVGLVGSLVAIRRGHRRTGAAAAVLNLLVMAPFGFLVLFFGLGGSR